MKHVLFAEFNDPSSANAAVRELTGTGVRPSRVYVHDVHEAEPDNEDRPIHETDARRGMLVGLAGAVVIGAFMGWMVTGPLDIFHISIGMGVVTGMLLGLAIGLIGGAISGAMNPNQALEKIEKHARRHGNVVATVEVDGVEQEEAVRDVFSAYGAHVEQRTI